MGTYNDFDLDIKKIQVSNDTNFECTSDTCLASWCYQCNNEQ